MQEGQQPEPVRALYDTMVRREAAADGPRVHRRKYMTTSLLIIDELGSQALDRHKAHLLFQSSTSATSVAAP